MSELILGKSNSVGTIDVNLPVAVVPLGVAGGGAGAPSANVGALVVVPPPAGTVAPSVGNLLSVALATGVTTRFTATSTPFRKAWIYGGASGGIGVQPTPNAAVAYVGLGQIFIADPIQPWPAAPMLIEAPPGGPLDLSNYYSSGGTSGDTLTIIYYA